MASQAPSAKRRRFDVQMIKVLVGSEEKCFTLHEPIMSSASRFFRAASRNGFRESIQKVIRLPEVAVNTFNNYVQWAYEGKIMVVDAEELEQGFRPHRTKYRRLTELYILADTLDDMRLRNGIIEEIRAFCKDCSYLPGMESIGLVYAQLPGTATLRRLIVDYHRTAISKRNAHWLIEHKELLPAEFIFDMAYNLMSGEKFVHPNSSERCNYHEHNDETPACAT